MNRAKLLAEAASQQEPTAEPPSGQPQKPPLEIGVVLAGPDERQRKGLLLARDLLLEELQARFPQFDWRLQLVRRALPGQATPVQPMTLLEQAVHERDVQQWDFVLAITNAELVSHYRPFAVAVVSRVFDAGVISTARLDPISTESDFDLQRRMQAIAGRIRAIGMHVLGHLSGLPHSQEPQGWMADVECVDDLDRAGGFADDELAEMTEHLQEVADERLEEQRDAPQRSALRFYLQSAWVNRHELANALWEARPWSFPIRLSRLTTAAVSTVLVLLMTGEVWDLALEQSWLAVCTLAGLALGVTTAYVLKRQQLLVRRGARRTEQTATTNLSILAIVGCGMIVELAMLFGLGLLVGTTMFPATLLTDWTNMPVRAIAFGDYALMSLFCAGTGICIGALGASFEEQQYFRHIVVVDEET